MIEIFLSFLVFDAVSLLVEAVTTARTIRKSPHRVLTRTFAPENVSRERILKITFYCITIQTNVKSFNKHQ